MFNTTTQEEMYNKLQESINTNNRLTQAEFIQFMPLFKQNDLSTSDYKDLCAKYQSRVSLFHPVNIVNAKGEVQFTLPAMFNQVDTINSNNAEDPTFTLRAFTNAIRREDSLNLDKERTTLNLINTIQSIQDKDRITKDLEQHTKLMDALNKTATESLKIQESDWDWEC